MPDTVKAEAKLGTGTLPPEVEAAILATATFGDVFPVVGTRAFGEQVLKAKTITFQAGATLQLTNYSAPWLAIVCENMQFVDTDTVASIVLASGWRATEYPPAATPPRAPAGAAGGVTQRGQDGKPGAVGAAGHHGDDAPPVPTLYIVCGAVADKQSHPIPAAMTLAVQATGHNGGNAGNGGDGGGGGDGGNGGNGKMGNIFEGCKHSACSGGTGGVGGKGGPGGIGGAGANGGNVVVVGPEPSRVSLSYAAFHVIHGQHGHSGWSGASGPSGIGGPRGSHPGTCGGGSRGDTPATPPTPHVQTGPNTAPLVDGQITAVNEDNVARFFA